MANGNALNDGVSVQVIKDLKVKGTSVTLKREILIKNIRLTDEEVECRAEQVISEAMQHAQPTFVTVKQAAGLAFFLV